MKPRHVRSGNGFRRPFFWWEGVMSNEQLQISVLHLLGDGFFTLRASDPCQHNTKMHTRLFQLTDAGTFSRTWLLSLLMLMTS